MMGKIHGDKNEPNPARAESVFGETGTDDSDVAKETVKRRFPGDKTSS